MTRKAYGIKKGAAQQRKSSLPLFLIGGALALIIIGVFVLLRGSGPSKAIQVAGKPRLEVNGDKIDLGKVPLNKPVSVEFELSNVGDKPLQLQGIPKVEVKEGCWPPNAVVGSTTIQPGKSTKLSMQFSMHEGMDGPHDFRVRVKTNDPDQPEKELIVLSDWG